MTDYWLSKLVFDLQAPGATTEYRADRKKVIARYPLAPEVVEALLADDVGFLAPRLNPYLLRYYFGFAGMSDPEFRAKLAAYGEQKATEATHG
jgi:hypothetical protein